MFPLEDKYQPSKTNQGIIQAVGKRLWEIHLFEISHGFLGVALKRGGAHLEDHPIS